MFSVGNRVVYGIHGVCEICAVENRVVDRKTVQFYVLQPVDQAASKYYVPCHNPAALAKLRPLLTKNQLVELLHSDAVRADQWISDEGKRKMLYRDLISSGNREALLSMVHTLHRHRRECLQQGRKFHLCDENFLRDAQRVLSAELSAVLEIPAHEVPAFVQRIFEE